MANSQFDAYAAFYDLLYKDKEYGKEADYIDEIVHRFLAQDRSKTTLLDLACGTGKHLMELSAKGYGSLSGSDISKSMVDIAEKNSKAAGKSIKFYNHSFQDSDKIGKAFDVVISMFSAIDYLTSYEDQKKTLRNIHGLLKPGGLFVFDFWNGHAVTNIYSPVKVLRKKNGSDEILRVSETQLDIVNQTVTVKFTCNFFKDNNRLADFVETHHLHFYYFSEMRNLMDAHGFQVEHVSPFMNLDKEIDPLEWNISMICRKR